MPERPGRDQAGRAAGPGPDRRPAPARRAAGPRRGRHPDCWSRRRPGFGKTTLLGTWLAGRRHRPPDGLGVARRARPGRRRRSGPTCCAPSTAPPRARPRRPSSCSCSRAGPDRRRADRAAQRAQRARRATSPWCSTTTTSPRARTSRPGWPSSSSTCRRRCTSSSAPAPTPRCPSRGCGPAVSWSRSAPPTCASPGTRRPPTSTTLNALGLRAGDVAALERRTEGWAAALQLAALSLHGRDDRVAVHRRVRRRRPVRRRLPRRRGPRPAAGRRAPVPARHLGPRPADRPAVRRGHRPDRTGRADAGVAGAAEPVRRPARRPPPAGTGTTTCSPTCCAPTCSTSGPATSPGCTAAPATGTTGPAIPRRRCGTRSPPATSTWRPPGSSSPSRRCCASAARRSSAAGSTSCPPTWCSDRPVLAVGFIGALAASNEFDGRRPAAGRRRAAAGRARPTTSSSSTTREPGPAAGGRADLPGRPRARRRRPGRHRARTPSCALDRAAADDHLTTASASALVGLASWTTGDLDAAHRALPGRRREPAPRGPRRGRARLHHHPRRHRDDPGPAGRRRAHLRRGPRAGRRRRRRCRGGGRHARAAEPGGAGTRRPGRCGRAACAGPTSSASPPACPQHPYRWRVAMAAAAAAAGRHAPTAVGLLEEAERVYVADFAPHVRPVAAARARVLAASGRGGRGAGVGAPSRGVGDRRADLPARVRARHPGAGPARRPHGIRERPPSLAEATPCSTGCSRPPRRAAAPASSSRCWCCRRSPAQRRRAERPWRRSSAPCVSQSRRATSGSSPARPPDDGLLRPWPSHRLGFVRRLAAVDLRHRRPAARPSRRRMRRRPARSSTR